MEAKKILTYEKKINSISLLVNEKKIQNSLPHVWRVLSAQSIGATEYILPRSVIYNGTTKKTDVIIFDKSIHFIFYFILSFRFLGPRKAHNIIYMSKKLCRYIKKKYEEERSLQENFGYTEPPTTQLSVYIFTDRRLHSY